MAEFFATAAARPVRPRGRRAWGGLRRAAVVLALLPAAAHSTSLEELLRLPLERLLQLEIAPARASATAAPGTASARCAAYGSVHGA
jgi:hypothetical protein